MLQSPLRRVTGIGEDSIPWSPTFNLEDAAFPFDDMGLTSTEFDIFQDFTSIDDSLFPGIGSVDAGSPIKRSAKRARLDRSVSTSALGECTASAIKKSVTSAPLLKVSEHSHSPSRFLDTPSKAFEGLGSPSKLFQQSPSRLGSPSKFSAMLELAIDNDWPTLGIDPSDFGSRNNNTSTDFAGLDILQGFEKIGSGSQSSRQQQQRGSKPSLSRSYSTAF
jgi:hypothetical protein